MTKRFPQISTARAGTFEVPKEDKGRKGILSNFEPELSDKDFEVRILETVRGEDGLQKIFDADIIVAGGRGALVDNLKLVQK